MAYSVPLDSLHQNCRVNGDLLDQLLKGYSYSSGSDTGKYMSQQSAEMQMYSYNRMEIADQLQLARFCNAIPIIKG